MKNTITGKDIRDMGFPPGKWYRTALDHINTNTLSKEEIEIYLEQFRLPPSLPLFETPVAYNLNIKAANELEEENIAKVKETMNQVMRTPTVINGSVMPDACPAGPVGTIPVGGVVATKNAIHPGMHSADICLSLIHI